jgi:hypothetical protein
VELAAGADSSLDDTKKLILYPQMAQDATNSTTLRWLYDKYKNQTGLDDGSQVPVRCLIGI